MPEKHVLRQFQALPLRAKILMTELRIREWYNHFSGKVFVSFSGGKDSTVLANLVHDNYPDVPLVFANTGLEYPEIQAFAKKMCAEFVRPKMRFDEVISTYGYPIVSKEVSESIHYARKIRIGGVEQRYCTTGKNFLGREQISRQNRMETGSIARQTSLKNRGGGCSIPQTIRRRMQLNNKYGGISVNGGMKHSEEEQTLPRCEKILTDDQPG